MQRLSNPSAHGLRRRALMLGAGAALLTSASGTPAQAQGCQGAPGSSAVEQYCEAIPRADGGRSGPSGNGGGGGGGSSTGSGSPLNARTQSALAAAGADGAAVERLAGSDGSGGEAAGSSGSSDGEASGTDRSAAPAEGEVLGTTADGPADVSGTPLKAATEAASNGTIAGSGLAWGVLGMSALGAIGAVALRRGPAGAARSDDDTPDAA